MNKIGTVTEEAIVNRFFGIFFCIFQMNNLSGNLISSLILSDITHSDIQFKRGHNYTFIFDRCGAQDCDSDYLPADEAKDPKLAYTLMAVYTGAGLLSIIWLWLFLDPLEMTESKGAKEARQVQGKGKFFALAKSTAKHWWNEPRQKLLMWVTCYSGFKQAFISATFTRSYVACPLSISWVGFIMMAYGLSDAFFSLFFGRLAGWIGKNTARGFTMGFALGLDFMFFVVCLLWIPDPEGYLGAFPFFFIGRNFNLIFVEI